VNIFSLTKIFMTVVLFGLVIGCASKYERYQNDITESLEPEQLLELTVNILSDDSLELKSKQELIKLLSVRAVDLTEIYLNSVNDGDIYIDRNLILLADFFRSVLNNREMIDGSSYEEFEVILFDLIRVNVTR